MQIVDRFLVPPVGLLLLFPFLVLLGSLACEQTPTTPPKPACELTLDTLAGKTEAHARHLAAIGPGQVLARGYSITFDTSGRAIRDAADVESGSEIQSPFAASELRSRVLPDQDAASSNSGE